MTRPSLCALALTSVASVSLMAVSPARPAAEIRRVAYVAATNSAGEFVTDLAPSDVVVKENKQARAVVALVPASERLHVAVLVDDGGAGGLRAPVAQLLSILYGRADFAISLLNPQPFKLNDYSADDAVLRNSVGKLVQRGETPGDPTQMIEAISWAAKDLRKREMTRPVVVALTTSGEPGKSYISDAIIEDLRESGAQLHVVYAAGVQMGRVLMDGPTRSGGSSAVANSTASFGQAAIAVGRLLLRQYRVTYVLPDGVKPHQEVEITSTRSGVTLVAPTRVPTK